MSISFTDNVDFNQNQALNLVLQNLPGAPSNPLPGQIYYDTATSKQRAYYYSPTGNGGNPGWILIDNPTVLTDNYVENATFSSANGNLTLDRTGSLSDIVVNLDGRYLTQNQTITLSGNVSGSGMSNITVSANPSLITDKPVGTFEGNFLIENNNTLYQIPHSIIQEWVWENINNSISNIPNYTLTTELGSPNRIELILTGNAGYTDSVTFWGTSGEIDIIENPTGSGIQIGLPDDVTVSNNLTVGGNLIVQGTTTTLNTTELQIEDNIITLNSNVTGTPSLNAGLEVERGTSTNTSLIWNETTDRWTFTNNGSTYYNIPIPSEYAAYSHPTYTPINIDGSGLQFIQDLTTDSLGSVTGAVLGTIPNATTTKIGVVRLTTLSETTGNNLATTPDTVSVMIDSAITASNTALSYKTTISPTNGSTTTVTHNLGTTDVRIELFDTSTGRTIYATTDRTGINTVNVTVGNLGSVTNIRVLITKV